MLDALLNNNILAHFVRSKNTQRNVNKRGIHDPKAGKLMDYLLAAKKAMNDLAFPFQVTIKWARYFNIMKMP